ncbi:MAG: DUF72 domain-containing protein [Chloroflexi bacterium]|nr:MAG: DUF72 domain-containing protein [Chloroflexota bacterium]
MMSLYIGTSGWVYPHWREVFYPGDLPQQEWLSFYARHFPTVEINNSFYRLPSEEAFKGWRETAPQGFIFAVKANRFITHLKKLKVSPDSVNLFLKRARLLGEKLGPILFQLPPRWRCNPGRLEAFLEFLPGDLLYTFEFRDESWLTEEVFRILEGKGVAFCIISLPGFECPIKVTAPFVYIRMHGSGLVYGGLYNAEELAHWAGIIRGFLRDGLDVYVYFNNDAFGFAVRNAREITEMIQSL